MEGGLCDILLTVLWCDAVNERMEKFFDHVEDALPRNIAEIVAKKDPEL